MNAMIELHLHIHPVFPLVLFGSLLNVVLRIDSVIAFRPWESHMMEFLIQTFLKVLQTFIKLSASEVSPCSVLTEDIAVIHPAIGTVYFLQVYFQSVLMLLSSVPSIEDTDAFLPVIEGMRSGRIRLYLLIEGAKMPVGQEFVDPVLRGIMIKKHRAVVGKIPVVMAVYPRIAAVLVLPDDIASRAHIRKSSWRNPS